jgi:hypothetical protein
MKMVFKGVEETFKNVYNQVHTLTEAEMKSRLANMLLLLEAATPVDTGYAKSRWKIEGSFPKFRVLNDASYIEYLDRGSSRQAPSFFIESIALRFGKPIGSIVTVMHSNPGS